MGPEHCSLSKWSVPQLSVAEPVSQLRRIRILECGEPLVDFLAMCPRLRLDRPRFTYRRETVVRLSVAEKLCRAASRMPKGYGISVIEGWRAPLIQQRMYRFAWNRWKSMHPDWSDVALKRVVNQYSAPMDVRVPPPHTTGAALDLALVDEVGRSLDMTSPFEAHNPKAFHLAAIGISPTAELHRRILSEALAEEGITNYPSEYWHYSYGDQGWAYRGSHPNAIYGAITPENWQLDPADVSEEPLALVTEPV